MPSQGVQNKRENSLTRNFPGGFWRYNLSCSLKAKGVTIERNFINGIVNISPSGDELGRARRPENLGDVVMTGELWGSHAVPWLLAQSTHRLPQALLKHNGVSGVCSLFCCLPTSHSVLMRCRKVLPL